MFSQPIRTLWRNAGLSGRLPRLLQIRWIGQITDGIFQSALASFVLFSPERQSNAVAAAAAFAVVLLPYSLVGPFVGVFLDRFSRQKIVQVANLIRALDLVIIALLVRHGSTGILLTLFVLVAFGLNRLILSGLSAGLPLIVSKTELIAANALAVTGGTIGVVIGGGLGIGIKNILDHTVKTDSADSILIYIACLGYVLASISTVRLKKNEIGPVDHTASSGGWSEMIEGFSILRNHSDALRGIFATGCQRGGLTALTLMGLLLERNYFHQSSNPDAGLRGFGFALAIAGIGVGVGSIITPFFVAKTGRHIWIRAMMVVSVPFLVLFALIPTQFFLILAAFVVGLGGQAVKVTNDALVQSKIGDEFRGRVFSFYDVVVNAGIVIGAVVAALILPTSGKSFFAPITIGLVYLLVTSIALRKSKFSARLYPTT